MKFARVAEGGMVSCVVVSEEELRVIPDLVDLLPLLVSGGSDEALRLAYDRARIHGSRLDPEGVVWLSPIATPPSIRDFYAFESHVKAGRASRGLDMEPDWYELPVFYFTNPYAVNGCGDVAISPGSNRFDFELEVAAILGRGGSNVTPTDGESLVAGYCVMNDWSARDLQHREMRLNLGPAKGKDGTTGLGPWLVTPDELRDHKAGNGYDLRMQCRVNGRLYSDAVWSDVYWSMGEMIAYASRGTEVRPGDVIGSGTCGTGCILELSQSAPDDYPWLQPGDEVIASIQGLGELRNRIVAGADPVPLRGGNDTMGM